MNTRMKQYYEKHEFAIGAAIFFGGFFFDLLTLGRIDDLFNLIQQALYLFILGYILFLSIKEKLGIWTPTPNSKFAKYWEYNNLAIHFIFGSLLSVYTIFYFTSASAITSFIFIILLVGLMLANEFPQFQRLGLAIRVVLFSICLISYLSFFYPIILGYVGVFPFWLGFLSSLGVWIFLGKNLLKSMLKDPIVKNNITIPVISVHLLFLLGYYFSFIPPVPIAVKKIGVYYDIKKINDQFIGFYHRPAWKFWQKGSQNFIAQQDDKIYVMLSIFSPSHFRDQIILKWYLDDPRDGWTLQDSIPMTISGGRDEGFRGYAVKTHYQAGDWRVHVQTTDGREIGRISFELELDPGSEVKELKQDIF